MRKNNNLVLPRDVWDDFSYRLAHTDISVPRGIDTFLAEAQKLNIRREGADVIVESKDIDEDAIIAALLASR